MTARVVRVLLLSSQKSDYRQIQELLACIQTVAYQLDWVVTKAHLAAFSNRYDVYLVEQHWLEAAIAELTPVIVLTDSQQAGLAALPLGATDYLEKSRLDAPTLERSLRLTQALADAQKQLEQFQQPDRIQLEQQLLLLQTITRAIGEAPDFESAIEVALRHVCETISWDFAEAWIPNLEANALELSRAWFSRTIELLTFRKVSETLTFAWNIGLPGRVWATRQAEWMQDVSLQPDNVFLRVQIAREVGLKAALSVPIIANNNVIAVFVFFTYESKERNRPMVELVKSVAQQLGLVFERKQAEEALRHSERRLRLIADALPVCISYLDERERYQFVNKTYERWFGYRLEEIYGKYLWEVIGKDAYRVVSSQVRSVLAGREVMYEAELPYPEGNRYVLSTLVPEWREESVKGYYALIADISDRKRAEEQLRYRLILETALSEVSRRLAVEEGASLESVLEILGIAVSASRAYLVGFEEDGIKTKFSYEWCDRHTQPTNKNLPELPPINAKLVVAIHTSSSQLWGQIGFDSYGENNKQWSEEDARLLQIVGEMIYSYHIRIGARESLQASEALYAGIFNHSADSIFLLEVTANDRFVYATVNPTLEKTTGIAAADWIGKTSDEVLPPNWAAQVENYFRACLAAETTIAYEEELILPQGKRTWRTTLVPIQDTSGRITKLQGSSRDITEEEQAIVEQLRLTLYQRLLASLTLKIRQSLQIEEILHTAVSELQKILRAERVVFFRLLPNGSVKIAKEVVISPFSSINNEVRFDSCCRQQTLSKYAEGEIEACSDVFHSCSHPFTNQFIEQYQIRANLTVPILCARSDLSAQSLWGLLCVQKCSQPREWTSDEIELLRQLAAQLGIALEQAQLREQETRQRQELARSNAELEQFAHITSHDLQEPLQTIANYAKLLKRRYQGQLDAKADKYIHYIEEGSQRMQALIQDLLEYSRVGTRQKPFQETDFNGVLEQVIANLKAIIDRQQAQVIVSEKLPTLMADSLQINQLFQNLVSNAIKYRSQALPVIQVGAELREADWLFSVRDNGIGINPNYANRIFQVFQRLHTQDEYPGTGIGLSICQRIVERHGGKIWVESQVDKGSTFFFTIPRQARPS